MVSAVSRQCADKYADNASSLTVQGIERVALLIRGGDHRKNYLIVKLTGLLH